MKAAAINTVGAGTRAQAGMPAARRALKGRGRWFMVRTPQGQEQAYCDKVRKVVSPDVLEDCFVMRRERWHKKQGSWQLVPKPLYGECFFAVTRDARALDRELAKLSFPVRVATGVDSCYVPLSTDAQAWFEAAMDDDHVLRNSVAEIVDGRLHVSEGPLVGQEARVSKVDRHRRRCVVTIAEGADGAFSECLPIDIPGKG